MAEGRPFPAKTMIIKMMLWWEAALANAVAAGDGTVYVPRCYFPCKVEAASLPELQESFLHLLTLHLSWGAVASTAGQWALQADEMGHQLQPGGVGTFGKLSYRPFFAGL